MTLCAREAERLEAERVGCRLSRKDRRGYVHAERHRIEPIDFDAFYEPRPTDRTNLAAMTKTTSIARPKAPLKKGKPGSDVMLRTGRHVFVDRGWQRIDRRDR